jgi:ABC-type uncharacterized transport system fused permease/ATPase subunit
MKIFNRRKLYIYLIALVIVELCLTMYLANWRSTFWNAVSSHNENVFIVYLIYFAIAALSLCFIGSYEGYLITLIALSYRTELTKKALKTTIDHMALSQIKQEDCLLYPQLLLNLIIGILRNACLLVIYGYFVVLVSPWYLLYPVIYAILSSLAGYKLAFPLINLNYINQNMEAKFRQCLTKRNYGKAFVNNFNLAKSTKLLGYWQIGVSQLSVVLPYICLASLYFSFRITFGILMQVASAMNSMTDCLGFYLQSFNDINKLLSCRKRLLEIGVLK